MNKDLRIFTRKLDICKICHNGTVARDFQAPFFFFIWSHGASIEVLFASLVEGTELKIFTAGFFSLACSKFLFKCCYFVNSSLFKNTSNVFFLRFGQYFFEIVKIKLDRYFSQATCDFLRFIMQYPKAQKSSARQVLQKYLFGFKSTVTHALSLTYLLCQQAVKVTEFCWD
jgi:hypothetical protein